MDAQRLFERYQSLQRYVGWTDVDAETVHSVAADLEPTLPALVEDFYAEIERHPDARKVITGGWEQIERLKGTLRQWLRELLSGRYDADYVARRWRVGYRHVDIGLDQVYTNVALSRLRSGLHRELDALTAAGRLDTERRAAVKLALDKLLDLDLAIIEDAYATEFQRRTQDAEKLATIGQVAGGVAHELRNPLNVIKTSVYFLLNAKSASDEKRTTHLGRIEKQVQLADGVITALTNFAKLPVPNCQPLALGPWIEACIRETLESFKLPECVVLNLDCPETVPPAWVDADQLRIVLRNLVRNACDAMPEGGRLSITARAAAGHVEIEVTDTGGGIAAEHLDRIMEPLFTTKARGIGLGLAMAKALVEKNNGRLSVASEPGRGTNFTVRLPQAPEADAHCP